MDTLLFLVVIIISVSVTIGNSESVSWSIPIVHAKSGETKVKLSCPIITDENKHFTSVLWLPENKNGQVIGAGAEYNHSKYRYLASTGQLLFTEEVTHEDEGVYNCIVRSGPYVASGAVQLMVKRIYGNIFEKEFGENIVRGGIAAGLAFCTLLFACVMYACRHQDSASQRRRRGVRSSASYAISTSPTSVTPGSSNFVPPKTPKTPPAPGQKVVTPLMDELILDPASFLNNIKHSKNIDSTTHSEQVSIHSIPSTPTPGHNKAPIDSSESTTSLISIRVNATPGEETCDGDVVRVKAKPGPTIIYITAADD